MITKLKSNSKYSSLYDPLYTLKTTVNGQLLLCMLAERFCEEIPDCEMLQINTDGMTIRIHKKYRELMNSICKRWENMTKLELESVQYSKMVIKDVNNYIAVSADKQYIKRKGAAFIYKKSPGELEMHKNFSALIIPKALEAYYIHGTDPEEFIRNHDNMYDFYKRTRINKSDQLHYTIFNEKMNVADRVELQRINRYYVAGTYIKQEDKTYTKKGFGQSIIKKADPLKARMDNMKIKNPDLTDTQIWDACIRYTDMEAGYTCSIVNDLSINHTHNIYYQYYIDEVYKVINTINNEL